MASKLTINGYLAAEHGEIYYEQEGNSSGASVLFIHGLGGTTNLYQPLLPSLQHLNLVRFDLSGHGRSRLPKQSTSIKSYVEDCDAIINNLKLQNITVVAHSLGGLIALHLAVKNPSLIKSLILFGPVKAPPQAGRDGLKARAELVRKGGMAAAADTVISGSLSSQSLIYRPEVVGLARELLCRQDPEGYAMACEALSGSQDPIWTDIKAQVVIICGGEDKVSSKTVCEDIMAKLESGGSKEKVKLKIWPGIGHWIPLEMVAESVKVIKENCIDT